MCYAPALVGGGFGPTGGHLQCDTGRPFCCARRCAKSCLSCHDLSARMLLLDSALLMPKEFFRVTGTYFFTESPKPRPHVAHVSSKSPVQAGRLAFRPNRGVTAWCCWCGVADSSGFAATTRALTSMAPRSWPRSLIALFHNFVLLAVQCRQGQAVPGMSGGRSFAEMSWQTSTRTARKSSGMAWL